MFLGDYFRLAISVLSDKTQPFSIVKVFVSILYRERGLMSSSLHLLEHSLLFSVVMVQYFIILINELLNFANKYLILAKEKKIERKENVELAGGNRKLKEMKRMELMDT